jgi:hypothetical protein
MTIELYRYPTREEIDALVRAARRDRAEANARLFHDVVRGLAELIASGLPVETSARARPRATASKVSPAEERPMAQSFWKTAAASLPPQVQWRYAGLFEAAERFELLLDSVVTARGRLQRVLARACRGLADALRDAARALDAAAWHLTIIR